MAAPHATSACRQTAGRFVCKAATARNDENQSPLMRRRSSSATSALTGAPAKANPDQNGVNIPVPYANTASTIKPRNGARFISLMKFDPFRVVQRYGRSMLGCLPFARRCDCAGHGRARPTIVAERNFPLCHRGDVDENLVVGCDGSDWPRAGWGAFTS